MSEITTRWFWMHDGTQGGPVSWEGLQALARAGQLRGTDLVLREGTSQWQPAAMAQNAPATGTAQSPSSFGPAIAAPPPPATFAPAHPYAPPPRLSAAEVSDGDYGGGNFNGAG